MFVDGPDLGSPGGFSSQAINSAGAGVMGDSQMMNLGAPHLTLAGVLVGLLALKFFSEADFLSLNPQELKISLWNTVNIGLMASAFIVLAKVGNAALLGRGIVIPGLPDYVGAL